MIKLKKLYEDVFDRSDMPQVSTDNLADAIIQLRKLGVDVQGENILISTLKKSQKQIDKDKVKGIADSLRDADLSTMKPIIISIDNYIVDGHHRAQAVKYLGRDGEKIPVIRIMLTQAEAIAAFKKVEDKL